MPVIAVVNKSRLDDADVAFYAAAVDAQLREDFVPRWAGLTYTPMTFFASTADLPTASGIARLMTIQDTIDVEGAGGYHDFVGVPRSVTLAGDATSTPVRMSHEAIEVTGDPNADGWVPIPSGLTVAAAFVEPAWLAKEFCDPCEGDTYTKAVTILAVTRDIPVSNFVLWPYFQAGSAGPFDFMGRISEPFGMSPGGYQIVRDGNDNVTDVWATKDAVAAEKRAIKLANPTSRTYRRGVRAHAIQGAV